MTAAGTGSTTGPAAVDELLALGDDALIAAQRLSQWCARAHDMEEDVALTNIALDQLGAARHLLTYAGEREADEREAAGQGGAARDEDDMAYLRSDREFRNALLVELPEPDFAVTMVKLLFLAARQHDQYQQLRDGADPRLAGIAATVVKESTYHLEHAALWTVRLGDGTDESHRRAQAAVDDLWPYTHELTAHTHELTADRRDAWRAVVEPVLSHATLRVPEDDGWRPGGGRHGRHTEHLSYLLAEMQVVHRAHPGAAW